jgi:spermidine synthase
LTGYYQVIVVDVYDVRSFPLAYATRQFFELAARKLDRQGVVCFHCIERPLGPLLATLVAAMESAFGEERVLVAPVLHPCEEATSPLATADRSFLLFGVKGTMGERAAVAARARDLALLTLVTRRDLFGSRRERALEDSPALARAQLVVAR